MMEGTSIVGTETASDQDESSPYSSKERLEMLKDVPELRDPEEGPFHEFVEPRMTGSAAMWVQERKD